MGEIEKKIPDHSKYITIPDLNKLTVENFAERLKEAKLATKSDIDNFVKGTDVDDNLEKNNKISSDKTKLLQIRQNVKRGNRIKRSVSKS